MSDPVWAHALKLLAGRDYSEARLRQKLARRFGEVPEQVIERLREHGYLDDGRYARNYLRTRPDLGPRRIESDLQRAGVPPEIVRSVLEDRNDAGNRPSIAEVAGAKMKAFGMSPPLEPREAARLSRALERLGYDPDEIRAAMEAFL